MRERERQNKGMMMLRSVSGVGSTQQARCTLCHTTSSTSTSLPSTHYGSPSPRARASSVQPLQSLQSNNRLLKPVALKDLSNSCSFRTGQSLRRFTPLKNAGPFENKTSLRWQKIEANALDAGQSGAADAYPEESVIPGGEQDEITTAKASAQRLKIGTYFVLWWSLNVVFNIYNKKVLNVFPYPWLTSTLSLAAGSTIMLLSWATRLAAAPELDVEFWKNLAPVRHLSPLLPSITGLADLYTCL